ncbi:MAG: glycosyltransferase family 4 protein, partial [Lachnospiraceae bacterium]|nr:glycosyltransferase family 4 protein [Lachnospiraceae bacterium]
MREDRIIVNYIGRTGGGASYSYEMTKGLIENGSKVTAIIPEGISNLDKWKELPFEELYIIKTYSDKKSFVIGTLRFLFIDQWKLRKKLKKKEYDFCYIPMIQLWTFLVNKVLKRGTPIVATLHDPIPHSGSLKLVEYFTVNKWVAAKADKLIILTEKFLDEVCRIYRKNKNQIRVIPHGIFDYSQYDNGQIIERDPNNYNFLFFGRIEKYKGIQLLLEAYNRLENERDDVSLYIVGKGSIVEYRAELEKCRNLTLVNRFVDDCEVSSFFRGERIITVLPYIDASQSGVAPIA